MTREEALKVIRGEIDLCEEESVDALELEDVYSFVERSIPLDRVKLAREEIESYREYATNEYQKIAFTSCLAIIDKLIAESEGKE